MIERYKEEEKKEDLSSSMMTLWKKGDTETSKREH
jgi:hypothetical protein